MAKLFDRLNEKKARDLKVLSEFVAIYCRENHRDEPKESFPIRDERMREALAEDIMLCEDCRKLLEHGIAKLLLCDYDPKPACRKCKTHCYAPGYREKVRAVMRFSGMYLLRHGRVDLLLHFLQ